MGLTQEYSQRWKWLKAQGSLVQDKTLRMAMMAEFRKRAYKNWGFDPETGRIKTTTEPVILSEWEQEFFNDIKKAQMFEVDTRVHKREKEAKEAKARMLNFISLGGCLKDIPEDIRTNTIVNLYYQCLNEYGDQLMEEADKFIKES